MAARMLYTAGITGVGMSFPEYRMTNAELEKLVDTNDQWIVERTGIKERRIASLPKGPGLPSTGRRRPNRPWSMPASPPWMWT